MSKDAEVKQEVKEVKQDIDKVEGEIAEAIEDKDDEWLTELKQELAGLKSQLEDLQARAPETVDLSEVTGLLQDIKASQAKVERRLATLEKSGSPVESDGRKDRKTSQSQDQNPPLGSSKTDQASGGKKPKNWL
jgi:chromosome segregation ATPase